MIRVASAKVAVLLDCHGREGFALHSVTGEASEGGRPPSLAFAHDDRR